MPFANIDSERFHYLEKGQGPAVVLLHGFPFDARMWEAQVEALSDRYRVIAPDLRGFGQTDSDKPFTIGSLADDVHRLLAAIDAKPCALGGLSMGGYVALAYVRRYPTDLRGLMLMDTKAAADSTEAKHNRVRMIELAKASGAAAVADAMLFRLLAQRTLQQAPQVVARVRGMMNACRTRTIEHAQLAMCDRPDLSCELPSIAVPTLVLVGAADETTPPDVAEGMSREIPHSQLRVIPNAGHLSPLEQPQAVNDAIREFLRVCLP